MFVSPDRVWFLCRRESLTAASNQLLVQADGPAPAPAVTSREHRACLRLPPCGPNWRSFAVTRTKSLTGLPPFSPRGRHVAPRSRRSSPLPPATNSSPTALSCRGQPPADLGPEWGGPAPVGSTQDPAVCPARRTPSWPGAALHGVSDGP